MFRLAAKDRFWEYRLHSAWRKAHSILNWSRLLELGQIYQQSFLCQIVLIAGGAAHGRQHRICDLLIALAFLTHGSDLIRVHFDQLTESGSVPIVKNHKSQDEDRHR